MGLQQEPKVAFYFSFDYQKRALVQIARYFCNSLITNDLLKIKKFEPDFIITSDYACEILKDYFVGSNVKIAALRHGAVNKYSQPETDFNKADYIFGTEFERTYLESGNVKPLNEFLLTGNPWVDETFKIKRTEIREKKPTILFAPTYNPEISAAIILHNKLYKLVREVFNEFNLIIKPHPAILNSSFSHTFKHKNLFQDWVSYWKQLEGKFSNVRFIEDTQASISDYFYETDILISDRSSLVWEFIILQKPILLFHSTNKPEFWSEIKTELSIDNFTDVGASFSDETQFSNALLGVFEAQNKIYKTKQKEYIEKIFGNFQDGLSSKRAADAIKKLFIQSNDEIFENAKKLFESNNFLKSYELFSLLNSETKYYYEAAKYLETIRGIADNSADNFSEFICYMEFPMEGETISLVDRISGWFLSKSFNNNDIIVLLNDKIQNVNRVHRKDVSDTYPEFSSYNPNPGFYLDVEETNLIVGKNVLKILTSYKNTILKISETCFYIENREAEIVNLQNQNHNYSIKNNLNSKNQTKSNEFIFQEHLSLYIDKITDTYKKQIRTSQFLSVPTYDILIPIYNAYDKVKTCIESVISHTDKKHKVYLLDDASPDKNILPMLESYAKSDDRIIVLSSSENLGFIGNMNRGFSLSNNDVIILNSDTQVTKNWIEKLHQCILSDPKAGIASPLSNNATILSVPEMHSSNKLPHNISVDEFAQIVEDVSLRTYPELPTAVGFCMLIKRTVLDEVGFFDPIFGLGYGEENDFCERAKQKGLKILCSDDTYVHHYGEASFALVDNIQDKRTANQRIIDERWPNYSKEIFSFCRANPLREIQERIYHRINHSEKKQILFVMHNFNAPGGTELHTRKIIDGLSNDYNSTVIFPDSLGYVYSDAVTVKTTDYLREIKIAKENNLAIEHFGGLPADLKSNLIEENFTRFLIGGNYDIVHFQHLSSWSTLMLPLIAKKLGKKVIISLHDFYFLCPELNLIYSYTNSRCGKAKANPDDSTCQYCLGTKRYNRIPEKAQPLSKYLVERNQIVKNVIDCADSVIVPSEFVKRKFLNAFESELNDKILVIPHGIDRIKRIEKYPVNKKFKVTFLGNASDRKGIRVFIEAIKKVKVLNFEFEVLGFASEDLRKKSAELKINFRGAYSTKDLTNLLQKTDLVLIASIVDETFSLTLSEAMMAGVPVLASDVGALKDRIIDGKNGFLFISGNASNLAERLIYLHDNSQLLTEVRNNLADSSVKTLEENVIDYKNIYKSLIDLSLNQSFDYIAAGEPSPKVSIVVPIYNQIKYTLEFLSSIDLRTRSDVEIVLIDNASTDKSAHLIQEKYPRVNIIRNEINYGFPQAINQGIQASRGKYILIANNDTVVTEYWLERLIEVAESDPKIGIVGPISNEVSGIQKDRDANYKTIDEMHLYAASVREKNKNKTTQFPRIAFLCTLIKREVINKIGGLDERFSPGNYEDDDFCLRAQLAGFKTVIANDVFIHHYGSKSFKADGENKYAERLRINRKIFVNKWGADPDEIWLEGKPINQQRSLFISVDNDLFIKCFERAQKNIEDKEYEFAFTQLQKACLEFDNSDRAVSIISKEELLILTANVALIINDSDSAKQYFEKALKLNSGSSEACFGLGQVFYKAEMFEQSKIMFEWSIKNDDKNLKAQEALKEVNLQLGLPAEHNSLVIGEPELVNQQE